MSEQDLLASIAAVCFTAIVCMFFQWREFAKDLAAANREDSEVELLEEAWSLPEWIR